MLRIEQLLQDLLDDCEEFAAYVVDRSNVVSGETNAFLEAVRQAREAYSNAQDERESDGIRNPSTEGHSAIR